VRLPLPLSRDEFVPTAPTLHASGRGRGKMHHTHDGGRVAEPLEYVAPGLSGLPGIVIGSHSEFGIFSLDRRMDHVTGDQCVVSGLAE